MDKMIIHGGERLVGEVEIGGAKNAALPLFMAALLTDEPVKLHNVPFLRDVDTVEKLLTNMGITVTRHGNDAEVHAKDLQTIEAPYDLVRTMRASILVMGPLIARAHEAKVSLPGGCAIGTRPINLHLDGFQALGAEIDLEHGYVHAKAEKLRGTTIDLPIPTVTGTENLMMAAALAEGTTIIENAAREPEVEELGNCLNQMGAKISGLGTKTLTIEGVPSLHGTEYTIMPDRVEAATYMVAAGMTQGNLLLKGARPEHLTAVVDKLREAGMEIKTENGGLRCLLIGPIKSVDAKTLPYPGFPTDVQAQLMAMMCFANGLSVISESVFENRFMHVSELKRMGADIQVEGHSAIIRGKDGLSGAPVMATDLRASASLVLAGLAAHGTTVISRIYHLDRGYERMEEKLRAVGAKIERIKAS
ncbi:MAG: UDP-N-acetylglucosamine 1-carboxyvinyltransferase [Deltaproteobacteria bacterium]|nr:MAG: UDP-N-acetylglucosamine 1-carboxyvinyltransferase [Deltaproteobacteria bacterium]